jgi:hypothetical protein
MQTYEEGQIVKGIKVGTFRVVSLETSVGVELAILKEVHPETHEDGPHPKLGLPLDCIKPFIKS